MFPPAKRRAPAAPSSCPHIAGATYPVRSALVRGDEVWAMPARCGWGLYKMGVTQQIDKIFSCGKLTGYGTSLVGGDVLRILEKLMPERFGGVPSDYQLVEQEGRNHTEYELRVNPRLDGVSPEEVRDFFQGEVKRLWGGSSTVGRWAHGQALKVALAEPYAGRTGKVLALHLLGSPGREENMPT